MASAEHPQSAPKQDSYPTPLEASNGGLAGGVRLDEDSIEDILFLARTNETNELRTFVDELADRVGISPSDVLALAFDPESGNGPTHMSAGNGHVETLKFLLPLLGSSDFSTTCPTSSAASGSASLLNWPNRSGNTPLHYAALNGQLEVAELLVTAGADSQVQNAAGHAPIFEAERAERKEVVAYLMSIGQDENEGTDGTGSVASATEGAASREATAEASDGKDTNEERMDTG